MDKLEVARRQLGTALHLFIHDLDPVSVHTLASAACEILEALAAKEGKEPFSSHAVATFPEMEKSEFHSLQRKYFNAFKHLNDRTGKEREDDALLESFSDQHNDAALTIGWYDYLTVCETLPIAAQVFQFWFFALHPEKLAETSDPEPYERAFPGLQQMDRTEQKRRLREVAEEWDGDLRLLVDRRTDPRPLVIPI